MTEKSGIQKLYRQDNQPFSMIPNKAIRDPELNAGSFRLLSYLMSHNDGYDLTYRQIERETGLGTHAIKNAVKTLSSRGWLKAVRIKLENGQYGPYSWTILTPDSDVAISTFSSVGDSIMEKAPDNKNKNIKEEKSKEYIPRTEFEDLFKEFYSVYPKKAEPLKARKAFDKAYAKFGDAVIEGARRLAADPNLPPKQFIPYPATWLNSGGWMNEPYAPRIKTAQEIEAEAIARANRQRELERERSEEIRREMERAKANAVAAPDCEHGLPLWRCMPCCARLADDSVS